MIPVAFFLLARLLFGPSLVMTVTKGGDNMAVRKAAAKKTTKKKSTAKKRATRKKGSR
jgi:hypothetical protein